LLPLKAKRAIGDPNQRLKIDIGSAVNLDNRRVACCAIDHQSSVLWVHLRQYYLTTQQD
jgi:hypothetical protein